MLCFKDVLDKKMMCSEELMDEFKISSSRENDAVFC